MPESHNEEDLVALTVLGLLDIESRARPSQAEASPRPTRDQIRRRLLPADREGGLSEEERRDLDNRRNTEQELPNSSINTLGRDGEPLGPLDVFEDTDSLKPRENVPEPIANRKPPRANPDEFQITDNGELSEAQKKEFVVRFGAREEVAKIPGVIEILEEELKSGPITATDTQFILQYLAQKTDSITEDEQEKRTGEMSKKTGLFARMWRRIFGNRNEDLLEKLKQANTNLTVARKQTVDLRQELEDKEAKLKEKEVKIKKLETAYGKALTTVQSATKISSPQKNRQLQSLQKKVQELTAKVQQEEMIAEANITTMQNSINDANEELKSAKSKNAKLQSELSKNKATFDNQIEKLTKKMREISAEKGALERQLTGEQAKQAAIDEQIGKNSKQLKDLNSTLESAMGALEAAQKDAENAKAAQVAAEARAAEAEERAAAAQAADEASQDLRQEFEKVKKENMRLRVEMRRYTEQLRNSLGANQSIEGTNLSGANRPVTPQKGPLLLDDGTSPIRTEYAQSDEQSKEVLTDNERRLREKMIARQQGQGQSPNSRRRMIDAARKDAARLYPQAQKPPGEPNGSPARKNLTRKRIEEIARERANQRAAATRKSSRQSNPVDRFKAGDNNTITGQKKRFKPLRF